MEVRMLDDEGYSPFEGIWKWFRKKFGFVIPLKIIRRPESLTIFDYRPTFIMFLAMAFSLFLAGSLVLLIFKFNVVDSFAMWAIGLFLVGSVVFMFRGTVREVYNFDKTSDSYTFVRQFIHRREVIQGSLSQFTGARVKTVEDDDSESFFVVLNQEGMFLTGASEQILREEVPIFNSFDSEARIATAISGFLSAKT